ncbi:hypothetical protein [Streptosporangium canum]|uniref:hypothetical protein n=1 Tax=Streptosporangium canum TaxID=324952 RepID=UPI0033B6ED08
MTLSESEAAGQIGRAMDGIDSCQRQLRLKGGGYDEVRLLTADGVFAMPEV